MHRSESQNDVTSNVKQPQLQQLSPGVFISQNKIDYIVKICKEAETKLTQLYTEQVSYGVDRPATEGSTTANSSPTTSNNNNARKSGQHTNEQDNRKKKKKKSKKKQKKQKRINNSNNFNNCSRRLVGGASG